MCFRLVLAVLTMAVLMNPGLRPAQASKQDVMQIDEMVVSATRREKKIEDVPASISVITSDAIEKTATVTLDDVFRYTPAVRVTRGQGMSHWHSSMSIRGMDNLIYVDGISMRDGFGGDSNLTFLPTEDIGKVEILRGPSSALYGGGAVGGVINIFSKMPDDGWHASLKPEYGNYDYKKYTAKLSHGGEHLSFSLSCSQQSIGNQYTRDEILAYDYDYRTGTRTYYDTDTSDGHQGWENWNHDYQDWRVLPKFFFKNESTKLTLSMGIVEAETGIGYTDKYQNIDGFSNVENSWESNKIFSGFSGETRFGKDTTLFYRASYHNPESKRWLENMDLTVPLDDQPLGGSAYKPEPVFYRSITEYGSKDYNFDVRLSTPIYQRHLVMIGAEYILNDAFYEIYEEGTNKPLTDPMDERFDSYAVYVQDEWQIIDPLVFTLGIRSDFYSDFDNQISPKGSLLYYLTDNTQLFGSVATAYNPPSISQTHGSLWNMGTFSIIENNPDLQPEQSISYEVGTKHQFANNIRAGLSGFWTESDDLISREKDTVDVGGTDSGCSLTRYRYLNIDEARIAGVEFETNIDIGSMHNISASYTYLDAIDKNTHERLEKKPKHSVGVTYAINWKPTDKFSYWASIQGRYIDGLLLARGDEENQNFFVADLSLGADILNHGQIFINATNVFDKKYQEFSDTRYQQGQQIWGGVNLYF